MAFKHLDDPLDYLYEELPEGEMAEMRKHLAECPQCREEIARVRETVKFYRRDPRPLPPADLTKRAMAAVRDALQPAVPATPEIDAGPEGDIADPHFENIKTEVRGELRSGKRKWLFHPAWAVAASVVFVFALLYHVSPRRSQWNGGDARVTPPGPAVIRDAAATQERDWSPLPAGAPRAEETPQPVHAPTPMLREAEVWDAPPPPAMAEPIPEFAPTQPPSGTAEAPKMRTQLAAPAVPAPTSLSPDAPVPMAEPLEPSLGPEAEDARTHAGQSAGKLPGEILTADDLEKLSALLDAAPDAGPVTIDMIPGTKPPPLIPYPPKMDTAELVRDFLFLAGLQMGHGEFEEARITIGLLRKYDAGKADELDEVLGAMVAEKEARKLAAAREAEEQAIAAEAAAGAVQDAETPEKPESETAPDKYFFVPEKENKKAEPVPEAEEIEKIKEVEETGETGEVKSTTNNAAVIEEISPESEPQAIDAEIPSPFVGPVYTDEPAAPVVRSEPAPAVIADQPTVEAPDVPKASPDAVPPTLWESSTVNSPAPPLPAREPRRRPFTTDPYFRDR